MCFPRKLKSNTRTYCVDKVNNLSQVGSKVILGLLQKEGFMKLTRARIPATSDVCTTSTGGLFDVFTKIKLM